MQFSCFRLFCVVLLYLLYLNGTNLFFFCKRKQIFLNIIAFNSLCAFLSHFLFLSHSLTLTTLAILLFFILSLHFGKTLSVHVNNTCFIYCSLLIILIVWYLTDITEVAGGPVLSNRCCKCRLKHCVIECGHSFRQYLLLFLFQTKFNWIFVRKL